MLSQFLCNCLCPQAALAVLWALLGSYKVQIQLPRKVILLTTRRLLRQLTEVCGCDDSSGALPKHKSRVVCDVGWLIIYRGDKDPHYSRDTLLVASNSLHRELIP
jgi:hypothetical protein